MRKRTLSLFLAAILMITAVCPIVGATYDNEISAYTVNNNPTRCGEAGIELIKSFESCRLTAYKAVSSERYWTIGWGHYGPDITEDMTITQEEADAMFLTDIVEYENYVNVFLNKNNISVNQSQYDALVSFTYNLGNVWVSYTGNFRLRNYLIAGIENYPEEEIRDAFVAWNTAGGVVLAGLTRRRNAECDLFFSESKQPTDPWLRSDKAIAASGEDIVFTFGAENAEEYRIIAYRAGSGTEEILTADADGKSCTVSFQKSGLMNVYVQCRNNDGYINSSELQIMIYEAPGAEFTTTIRHKERDEYLETGKNGIFGADENGYADQMWYFKHQTDGAYIISSCYNGEYLTVENGTVGLSDAAGEWYIWQEARGYVLRDRSSGMVLCLNDDAAIAEYNGSKEQIWEFDINEEIAPQKPQLNVVLGNDVFETIINWTEGYGAKGHTLLLWKDVVSDSEPYLEICDGESPVNELLPLGTYQGYVEAYHEYGSQKSQIITFTVTNDAIVKYDANGGTDAPVQQQKAVGKKLTVSEQLPTKAGHAFVQWNTAADGSGTGYASGTSYADDSNVILYAIWEPVSELTGDVNSDMAVSNIDLIMLARYIVGLNSKDGLPQWENGDMNGDGIISNSDVVALARRIVGY